MKILKHITVFHHIIRWLENLNTIECLKIFEEYVTDQINIIKNRDVESLFFLSKLTNNP